MYTNKPCLEKPEKKRLLRYTLISVPPVPQMANKADIVSALVEFKSPEEEAEYKKVNYGGTSL